jgi:UTP:GlnB (protein PII) uridylyltransferase
MDSDEICVRAHWMRKTLSLSAASSAGCAASTVGRHEISGLNLKTIADPQENGMAVSSHLSIDNQSHSNYTIIEIEAPDRDGLFYDLVRALHAHNISIDSARIATEMRAAFDTFYILDSNRKKVTDEVVLTALRDRLTSIFPLEESLHNITKFNL